MKYELTEKGKKKIEEILEHCTRDKELILEKNLDTVENIHIPTMEEIMKDVEEKGVDKTNTYFSTWQITDKIGAATVLLTVLLRLGTDLVEAKTTRLCITLEKTIRVCKYVDATEEQMQQIEDGENPFFDEMLAICDEKNGDVEYDYAIENDDTGMRIVDWD